MTDKELQEIEDRCNKATEGPWYGNFLRGQVYKWAGTTICSYCETGKPLIKVITIDGANYHLHKSLDDFREIVSDTSVLIACNYDEDESGVASTKEDAEFMAHARQDIPALLAEIKRLQMWAFLLEGKYEKE